MVMCMMEKKLMERNKGMVLILQKMGQAMQASILMMKGKVQVNVLFLMEIFTMENGKMVISMVLVPTLDQMVQNMLASM